MSEPFTPEQRAALETALQAFDNNPSQLAAALVTITERPEFAGTPDTSTPSGVDAHTIHQTAIVIPHPTNATPPSPHPAPSRPANHKQPDTTTPVIIALNNVSRQYHMGKNQVHALQDLSLQIHEGEFVAITGASGSGKSTLLNLIGGLDRPDSGDITVAEQNIAKLNDNALSHYRNHTIGFVFQFFYLQPFLNVRRNLEVPAMFGRTPQVDRQQRIAELAAAVGLTDRLNHLPRELSGGQMQRAAIARALMNQPRVLLADEPTGNLDSVNSHSIMELFQQVRRQFGTTIVVVTHDPDIAQTADRIISMHDGRIM